MQSRNSSFLILLLFSLSSIIQFSMATPSSEATVQIVYTEKPVGVQPEAHHTSLLASVLGSEEAAKEALVYVYKNAATGFSAKLTPEQVAQLSKQPGVLQIVPSRTYQLHGPGMLH
ncbi:Peptidase S8 propeptide/proteinase inhibitor I9 [Dillenia turbinata]|uniref:Peptidase S8 propeptide/proteinase inhibitor I9 n=1 Tax=Dillenia turbinata TaxID=194707 RepID=A0AAN8W1L6_9MAGN